MIRRHKWLLGFSIIFWLVVVVGIALNALALQKVPLGNFGLKTYFFSPNLEPTYFTPGLYDIGVGYYFLTFPSDLQYLVDQKMTAVNINLKPVNVTYSLTFRLLSDHLGSTQTSSTTSTKESDSSTSSTSSPQSTYPSQHSEHHLGSLHDLLPGQQQSLPPVPGSRCTQSQL